MEAPDCRLRTGFEAGAGPDLRQSIQTINANKMQSRTAMSKKKIAGKRLIAKSEYAVCCSLV